MSILNFKDIFSAKEARGESFSNNPHHKELIEIMNSIKEITKEGLFTKDLSYLIEETNFKKLQELEYHVSKDLSNNITTISW